MAPLAERLYLLAYDPRRQYIAGGSYFGALIRAALLEDLRLQGALTDESGRVRATGRGPSNDPVLAEIAASAKPRPWRHWISANQKATLRDLRDRLDDRLVVRVEPFRILGLFPSSRVRVRDLATMQAVRDQFEQTLTGHGPADPRDAAAVTLANAAELGPVLPRRRRKEFKARIADLTAGPVVPALRYVVRSAQAAAVAASTAGG